MDKLLKREASIDIIISAVLAIVGIIIMVKPQNTLNVLAIIIGGVVVLFGIILIIKFFLKKDKIEDNIYSNNLILGIMLIIIGIVLYNSIGIMESILRIVIGIWMTYNALVKLEQAQVYKNINKTTWISLTIVSIVTVLFGLYIMFYFGALIKIFGTIILIYSLLDIIETIIYMSKE